MQKEQIPISKKDFELWFNTPLKTIESDNLPEKKYINDLYSKIRIIDTNKEMAYYQYIQTHFLNELLEKNLFCLLLLNYLLNETDTTFKRKNFNIDNEKKFSVYIALLNKQLETADAIFWGVFELVKNVVNHAKIKVNNEWQEANGRLIIEIVKEDELKKDRNNNGLWVEYLSSLKNKAIKPKSFLRISLGDNGERGIIETTMDYMSEESKYRDIPTDIKEQDKNKIVERIGLCKNKTDEAQLLFDMYFSGSNSFLVRQHKHALKGIGLYKFTKFLSKVNGFLNVQTNKYQNKNDIIAFSLFDTPKLKSPLIQSNLFGFSDYHIILPLQKIKQNKNKKNEEQEIENQALSKSTYEEMLSLQRCKLDNENILHFEDDFNAEYSEYAIRKKEKKQNIYVCSFEMAKDIDISPLFRSISRFLEVKPEKKEIIVIRNLSKNSIRRLCELYEDSDENADNKNDEPFFFKNKILLLLTDVKENRNKGVVIAGIGDTKVECFKINQYIKQNNANFDVLGLLQKKDSKEQEFNLNTDNILSQYSLFVRGQLIDLDAFEYVDKEKKTTFFEDKTKRQLKRRIDDVDSVGYNWTETHLKIGSKLHLRDFVYGKKIFQRSDKASTFAFLLAKDMFENIKLTIDTTSAKKITYTLVGYGYYSELMVSRTCDFIKKLFKLNDIPLEKADVEYVIVKDEDEVKFSKYFHNLQSREKQTLEKLIIVVPISSTLTTCLKIENTFDNVLNNKLNEDKNKEGKDKKYREYKKEDFKIIEPFYTTIVVGDKVDIKEISERLKDKDGEDYKTVRSVWEGVDIQKKEIVTRNRVKNKERRNHFNIYIQSEWQLPYNCKYCFPKAPIQERPIFVTDKVSVTPSLIFDTPEWYAPKSKNIKYKEPYFKFEKDVSDVAKNTELPILDKIHWAHYKGDGNKHFNYYFNYLDFIKNNEPKLTKWAKEIEPNFKEDKNKRILLIAPDKAENGRFIHIINREVFDDRASVIRFDKNSDNYLNFGKFFEKDIKQADSVYFVDNLMLSGKTFFSIDEILKTAQKESDKNEERKIKAIFSLVNRMDYICFNAVIDKLKNNSTNSTFLYSFLQLNVLESTIFPCPLCDEKERDRKSVV